MKQIWRRLKFLGAFLALVRDPNKTEKIFEIGDSGRNAERDRFEQLLAPILNDPEFQALWTARTEISIDLMRLQTLPEGTFGRETAAYFERHGFTPLSFPRIERRSSLDYLADRMRQIHDFWHVLTGYSTEVVGELALQGFTMAQVGSPLSAVILSGGLLHLVIFRPMEVGSAFAQIVEGYRRGKAARRLVTLSYDTLWERDLAQLQRELGIGVV